MSYLQSMTMMSGEHDVLPTEHDKHDVQSGESMMSYLQSMTMMSGEHDVLPTEHDNDVWRA